MASNFMIIPDIMHQFFKSYKFCEDSELRYHLTEIEHKVILEDVRFRNYMDTDIMKYACAEYNICTFGEDIPC